MDPQSPSQSRAQTRTTLSLVQSALSSASKHLDQADAVSLENPAVPELGPAVQAEADSLRGSYVNLAQAEIGYGAHILSGVGPIDPTASPPPPPAPPAPGATTTTASQ